MNAARNGDSPGLAPRIRSSARGNLQRSPDPPFHARGTGQIDSEDENITVSIADADGPLYSSLNIEDHDDELLSACVEPRCQPDPGCGLQGAGFNAGLWRTDKTYQNGSEGTGRHEENTGISPYNAAGPKTMFCRRCGHELGSLSSSKMTVLQKSYLTSLQNSNRTQSNRGFGPSSVYVTDMSSVGSGLTERPEHQRDVPGVQTGDFTKRQHRGVWVEEDGCVFKPLVCASCPDLCVGVHIMAVDSENVSLVNKVCPTHILSELQN